MALIHRMKVLLSVLQELGGSLPDSVMQKMLFLYCKEFVKRDEYYELIPLAGKAYSIQAAEDKNSLINRKILEKSTDWVLIATKKRFAVDLDFFEKIAIQDLKNKFAQKNDAELDRYISENYKEYFIKPEYSGDDEIIFYTIGYEGLSPEAYVNLLLQNKVRLLVDVRKNAFSQKYGFSKAELSRILSLVGIEYRHIPELGIDSDKRKTLNSEKEYEDLFREYEKTTINQQQVKLDKLQLWLEEARRIAITCFEAEQHHCHRSRIAKALKARNNFFYRIEHLQLCRHLKNHK